MKLFISIFIIIFLSSCSSNKTYSYSNYHRNKINDSKAIHKATMRPYIVNGKKYYPTMVKIGDTFRGIASWYGPNFHMKKTSNGEIYNMYSFTAAHKTLPMNTMLEVINLENNKKVIVRINDRGPFVSNRIIDLSKAAARKLDMIKKGTAKVKIKVIGFHGKVARSFDEKKEEVFINKYFLQVGAFKYLKGAKEVKEKFQLILDNNYKVIIKKTNFYRVFITGFKSYKEALNFAKKLKVKAIIIAKD